MDPLLCCLVFSTSIILHEGKWVKNKHLFVVEFSYGLTQLLVFRELEKTIVCECVRYRPVKKNDFFRRKRLLLGDLHINYGLLENTLILPDLLDGFPRNLLRINVVPCMLDSGFVSPT